MALNRAEKKKRVRKLILSGNEPAILGWIETERTPDRVLFSLLFDPDPNFRWRTIEAVAVLAEHMWTEDPEILRKMIRTVFWNMNDESGGLMWNGPEVIGRILIRVPQMVTEYGRILANFIVEEPFERGTHWAMMHVVPILPEEFADVADGFIKALDDPDPNIRAFSAATLPALGNVDAAKTRLEKMIGDDAKVDEYDMNSRKIKSGTVGSYARRAVETA
jgi:hypothetical protein